MSEIVISKFSRPEDSWISHEPLECNKDLGEVTNSFGAICKGLLVNHNASKTKISGV